MKEEVQGLHTGAFRGRSQGDLERAAPKSQERQGVGG